MSNELLPNEDRDPKIYIENLRRALNSNEEARKHYFPNFVGNRKTQNEKLTKEMAVGFADFVQWFEDYQQILDIIPLAYKKLIVHFSLKKWTNKPERVGVCMNLKQFRITTKSVLEVELINRGRALACSCSGLMLLEYRGVIEYQGIETHISDFRCFDCGEKYQAVE